MSSSKKLRYFIKDISMYKVNKKFINFYFVLIIKNLEIVI